MTAPFPQSLCHRCRHLRLTGNKRGSVFLQCTEASLPKYPPQPVRACTRLAPGTPDAEPGVDRGAGRGAGPGAGPGAEPDAGD